MVIEIISPSLLRPALYNKKVLIWLYLVKVMSDFREKKMFKWMLNHHFLMEVCLY